MRTERCVASARWTPCRMWCPRWSEKPRAAVILTHEYQSWDRASHPCSILDHPFCALPISHVWERSLSLQQNHPSFPFSIHVCSPFQRKLFITITVSTIISMIGGIFRAWMNTSSFLLSLPYLSSIWDRGVMYIYWTFPLYSNPVNYFSKRGEIIRTRYAPAFSTPCLPSIQRVNEFFTYAKKKKKKNPSFPFHYQSRRSGSFSCMITSSFHLPVKPSVLRQVAACTQSSSFSVCFHYQFWCRICSEYVITALYPFPSSSLFLSLPTTWIIATTHCALF